MSEPNEHDREMAKPFAKEFRDWVVESVDFWSECDADSVLENTITAAIAAARAEGDQAGYARGRIEGCDEVVEKAIAELCRGLFDAIAHGDEAHRSWLKQAIEDHFAGRPVQKPAGEGGYERGRREAIEECAEKASWAIHDAGLPKGDTAGNYQARVILAQAAVGAIRALAEPSTQQASQPQETVSMNEQREIIQLCKEWVACADRLSEEHPRKLETNRAYTEAQLRLQAAIRKLP